MQNFIKTSFCCLVLFTASACTPVTAQRGNMLEEYQTDEIKIGESTRSDVLKTLGSPTTQSTFDNDIWYYIGQETKKRGILDSEVAQERIVEIQFSPEGIVTSITSPDVNRENIPYARTKTPTHGSELTFSQQLLGNLGRFNGPKE